MHQLLLFAFSYHRFILLNGGELDILVFARAGLTLTLGHFEAIFSLQLVCINLLSDYYLTQFISNALVSVLTLLLVLLLL